MTTAVILLLIARLLLRDFVYVAVERENRISLRFIDATPPADAVPIPPAISRNDATRARSSVSPPNAPPVRLRDTTTARLNDRIYTSLGEVRVPPGSRIDPMKAPEIAANPPGLPNERELDKARKVLERRNPIEYDRTVFDKDWKSDGTLGDVAAQSLNRGAKKIADAIFGKDIQSPTARPPPDVRYNPALYDQKSDLGRAETGDAYKAAPIVFEKAPGLEGEASRRIRTQMATLQQRTGSCDAQKVKALLQPVRTHLTELEQVEHAMGNGADPVMAAQMLPRRGDSAYDLARRALWYANDQLASCKG